MSGGSRRHSEEERAAKGDIGTNSPKALPSKRRQEFLREPGNFKAEVGKIPGRRDLSAEKGQKFT